VLEPDRSAVIFKLAQVAVKRECHTEFNRTGEPILVPFSCSNKGIGLPSTGKSPTLGRLS
jgi:hypothetical protein